MKHRVAPWCSAKNAPTKPPDRVLHLQQFLPMWIFAFPPLFSWGRPKEAVTIQGRCPLLPQPQLKPAAWGWLFEGTGHSWAVLWNMPSLQPHHVFSLCTCLRGFHIAENNGKSDFHTYFCFECWRVLCNPSSCSDTSVGMCERVPWDADEAPSFCLQRQSHRQSPGSSWWPMVHHWGLQRGGCGEKSCKLMGFVLWGFDLNR